MQCQIQLSLICIQQLRSDAGFNRRFIDILQEHFEKSSCFFYSLKNTHLFWPRALSKGKKKVLQNKASTSNDRKLKGQGAITFKSQRFNQFLGQISHSSSSHTPSPFPLNFFVDGLQQGSTEAWQTTLHKSLEK